jgi:hypothetical protein
MIVNIVVAVIVFALLAVTCFFGCLGYLIDKYTNGAK